jgi:hypothetical protein
VFGCLFHLAHLDSGEPLAHHPDRSKRLQQFCVSQATANRNRTGNCDHGVSRDAQASRCPDSGQAEPRGRPISTSCSGGDVVFGFLEPSNQKRFKFSRSANRKPDTFAQPEARSGAFRASTEVWVVD